MVRTPPMVLAVAVSLGKPRSRKPTSVVVPPMSTTTASCKPVRKAAPRMLLVGPAEQVKMGKRCAYSVLISVPSFWLI